MAEILLIQCKAIFNQLINLFLKNLFNSHLHIIMLSSLRSHTNEKQTIDHLKEKMGASAIRH